MMENYMKVLETGHIYQPANRQTDAECEGQTFRFINKQPGQEHGGTDDKRGT